MKTYNNYEVNIDMVDVMPGGALNPQAFGKEVDKFLQRGAAIYRKNYAFHLEKGNFSEASAVKDRVRHLFGDFLNIQFIRCNTRLSRKARKYLVDYVKEPYVMADKLYDTFGIGKDGCEDIAKMLFYVDYIKNNWLNVINKLV